MKYNVNGTEVFADSAKEAAYLWACDISLTEAIKLQIDIDPCLQIEVTDDIGTLTLGRVHLRHAGSWKAQIWDAEKDRYKNGRKGLVGVYQIVIEDHQPPGFLSFHDPGSSFLEIIPLEANSPTAAVLQWVKNTGGAGSTWGDGENITLKVLDPKGEAHEVCLTRNWRMSWHVKMNGAE